MKKRLILATVVALTIAPASHAQSWWDSIKSMLGMGESTEEQTQGSQKAMPATVDGLVKAVQENLGITEAQAEQGIASILNFLKTTAESQQFAELKASLPGVDQVLASVPDVSEMQAEGALGSLLQKAAEYSESLKAVSDLQKQFEAAGLKPEMIQDFAKAAEGYLDTPEGKAAKEKFSELFNSLMPEG